MMISDEKIKEELLKHPKYEKYLEWKRNHPDIYSKFKELCIQLISKERYFGISLITERIRWDYKFDFDEEFKITNDFRSLISRELMLELPPMRKYCKIKEVESTEDKLVGGRMDLV